MTAVDVNEMPLRVFHKRDIRQVIHEGAEARMLLLGAPLRGSQPRLRFAQGNPAQFVFHQLREIGEHSCLSRRQLLRTAIQAAERADFLLVGHERNAGVETEAALLHERMRPEAFVLARVADHERRLIRGDGAVAK